MRTMVDCAQDTQKAFQVARSTVTTSSWHYLAAKPCDSAMKLGDWWMGFSAERPVKMKLWNSLKRNAWCNDTVQTGRRIEFASIRAFERYKSSINKKRHIRHVGTNHPLFKSHWRMASHNIIFLISRPSPTEQLSPKNKLLQETGQSDASFASCTRKLAITASPFGHSTFSTTGAKS